MVEIVVERPPGLVVHIDVTGFPTFVAHMQPACSRADVGMGELEPGDITHLASCPITQDTRGGTARRPIAFNQLAQDKPLIGTQLRRRE